MPAPKAISQPTVPAWVALTSMVAGRPTGSMEAVCSCAVTRTVPLVRASTWAVPWRFSPAAMVVSPIGWTVSRCRLDEAKSSRTLTAFTVVSAGSSDGGSVLRIVIGKRTLLFGVSTCGVALIWIAFSRWSSSLC